MKTETQMTLTTKTQTTLMNSGLTMSKATMKTTMPRPTKQTMTTHCWLMTIYSTMKTEKMITMILGPMS
jgi:hypothetical protein